MTDLSRSAPSRMGANPGAAGGVSDGVHPSALLGTDGGQSRSQGALRQIRQDPHGPLQQTGTGRQLGGLSSAGEHGT